jgi:hypothetical protein
VSKIFIALIAVNTPHNFYKLRVSIIFSQKNENKNKNSQSCFVKGCSVPIRKRLYSQHFIFFVTYEWVQYARLFFTAGLSSRRPELIRVKHLLVAPL